MGKGYFSFYVKDHPVRVNWGTTVSGLTGGSYVKALIKGIFMYIYGLWHASAPHLPGGAHGPPAFVRRRSTSACDFSPRLGAHFNAPRQACRFLYDNIFLLSRDQK